MGLLTIAALRELAPDVDGARGRQARRTAQRGDALRRRSHLHARTSCTWRPRGSTGARRLVGRISRRAVARRLDGVLDCVGSSASLQAAVSAARPRGVVTLVGMPGHVSVDLALAWQRELQLRGAYGYGGEFGPRARSSPGACVPAASSTRRSICATTRPRSSTRPRAARTRPRQDRLRPPERRLMSLVERPVAARRRRIQRTTRRTALERDACVIGDRRALAADALPLRRAAAARAPAGRLAGRQRAAAGPGAGRRARRRSPRRSTARSASTRSTRSCARACG